MPGQAARIRRKTAVVTGAGGGIGSGLAIRAAEEGFDVAICDVDAEGLARTERGVTARGAACVAEVFDIRDEEAVRAFADRVETTESDIGLVFANAGVLRRGALHEMSRESIRLTVDVNLMSVLYTASAFLPRMLRQAERSRIVFTGSLASIWTLPALAMYSATKQAVRVIADSYRAQFVTDGAPVDVSLLAPGPVRSGIYRFADARDRPEDPGTPNGPVIDEGLTPAEAADVTFRAIAEGRYLIATHPQFLEKVVTQERERLRQELSTANPTTLAGAPLPT